MYGNSSEDLGSDVDHSKDISTALWVSVDNGYKGIPVINFQSLFSSLQRFYHWFISSQGEFVSMLRVRDPSRRANLLNMA